MNKREAKRVASIYTSLLIDCAIAGGLSTMDGLSDADQDRVCDALRGIADVIDARGRRRDGPVTSLGEMLQAAGVEGER